MAMIIFLNGTSSSGKSTLAAELLQTLDGPFFHLAVDAFGAMRAKVEIAPEDLDDVLRRTRMGFHRAIAGMAAGGNDIVVDHILSEPWRLSDLLDVLADHEVVLVGVRCPLEELERRELARGDRPSGLAAMQYDRVHAHGIYDIEVDTYASSAAECAQQIKAYLNSGPALTAFDRLRKEAAADASNS
ncbi:chloramphenicol 3-O phosphotransferase [Kitasatospora sp. MAA4]|uniref:chloramphenicol phosphotransferase CPT family protein n=1 Tax=Kitasatospora sp. MAA4 TaxID=3035093 RepID=UPI0024772DC3|nr:AAA family ATPase [Kitasatospora sp. MAA4]MDH6135434.1 chloramphenicol 3-O phosphotransferase [Kitasatospora sp. MAA4]